MRRLAIYFGICGGMLLVGCVQMQHISLYPKPAAQDNAPHISNVYALQIFEDYLSAENWYTLNKQCIQVKQVTEGQYSGNGALQITWNKPQSECDWIGMGFGWDDWYAKDLHAIMDSASLEFYVRNIQGTTKGLPWALALEDYGNAQAWAGMTPNYIENGQVTEAWTKVTIPLHAFDITVQQPDLYSIKQLLIQFEGQGNIMIDQIRLVLSAQSGKKESVIHPLTTPVMIDGQLSEPAWKQPFITMGLSSINLSFDNHDLYICAQVKDNSPMVNTHTGDEIWNGDAIELAFSTNAEAEPYRKKYLLSDKHIGIRVSETPEIFDWSLSKPVAGHETRIVRTTNGYIVESKIPWSALSCKPWKPNADYGFEAAIDHGDITGKRTEQIRWNNNYTEGFHTNPSMWGLVHIGPTAGISK